MTKVQDVMNAFPITVEKETTIVEVFRIIREKHLSHLLVVSDSILVGVISKVDLLNAMLELSQDTTGKNYNELILRTTPVGEIMSTRLLTVRPEDNLHDAIQKMLTAGVHCLPVVNVQNQPIGILNILDLLRASSKV